MTRQLSLFDFLHFPTEGAEENQMKVVTEKNFSDNRPKKQGKEKTSLQEYAGVLANHIPPGSIPEICNTLEKHSVILKITKKRFTKLGDYRAPHKGLSHRITINHDLNKFSFLVTLVHELAHLFTWEKYKRNIKPHGAQWKREFRFLMQPFINKKFFPQEVVICLNHYLENPAASSCTDISLLKTLKKFDSNNNFELTKLLEDIPEKSVFSLSGNSKVLIKGKKLRKRYLCSEINSKRKYLVSPVAEVLVKQEAEDVDN